MRPVLTPSKPADYPPATTVKFQQGANAVTIAANTDPVSPAGTTTFSIESLLGVWLKAVKDQAPKGSDLEKARNAISNRIADVYKLASVPLTQGLGPYCSYCESPLSGLVEVEHCAPKSNYPTYSVNWDNFLLACSACNNTKGNEPDRQVSTEWTGIPAPTEAQLYDQIRSVHNFFPDLKAGSYHKMPIILQYESESTGQWTTLSPELAADTDNFIVSQDLATRKVVARLYSYEAKMIDGKRRKLRVYTDRPVQAIVVSNTAGDDPDVAQEMINLCGLNVCKTMASTYDRRVMNRTIAWFTALQSIKRIEQYQGQVSAQNAMWNMMKHTAAATGFYSVWVKLLAQRFTANTVEAFVTQTNIEGMYPGTNTAGILP